MCRGILYLEISQDFHTLYIAQIRCKSGNFVPLKQACMLKVRNMTERLKPKPKPNSKCYQHLTTVFQLPNQQQSMYIKCSKYYGQNTK